MTAPVTQSQCARRESASEFAATRKTKYPARKRPEWRKATPGSGDTIEATKKVAVKIKSKAEIRPAEDHLRLLKTNSEKARPKQTTIASSTELKENPRNDRGWNSSKGAARETMSSPRKPGLARHASLQFSNFPVILASLDLVSNDIGGGTPAILL